MRAAQDTICPAKTPEAARGTLLSHDTARHMVRTHVLLWHCTAHDTHAHTCCTARCITGNIIRWPLAPHRDKETMRRGMWVRRTHGWGRRRQLIYTTWASHGTLTSTRPDIARLCPTWPVWTPHGAVLAPHDSLEPHMTRVGSTWAPHGSIIPTWDSISPTWGKY